MALAKSVAVTGAMGNLGQKLLHYLAAHGAPRLVGLDVRPSVPDWADSLRRVAAEYGHRPDTISASGSPTLGSDSGQLDAETLARTERWFKGMWLSNRDFAHLFERAIEADAANWPEPCIIVNGMSNNSGLAWSLDETRRWLGYEPQDDMPRG
jgi:hypothetical protein